MRISHLTTFLQGGAGRIIVELAREQQRQGHEVTVVASRRGVPGYGNNQEYLDTLSSLGMPVKLVSSTFERIDLRTVAAVTAVDRLFAAGREPEVIHSHAAVASLIGLLVPTSAERRSGSCRPCTDGDRPRPPSSRQPTSAF